VAAAQRWCVVARRSSPLAEGPAEGCQRSGADGTLTVGVLRANLRGVPVVCLGVAF